MAPLSARPRTEALFLQSLSRLPGGVSSPVRSFRNLHLLPLMAEKGEGELLIDCDGNRFIDYCMSWGSLLAGHAHPLVMQAVQDRMRKGFSFGVTGPLESEMAEIVFRHIPSMEKIRFVSSGTEATMSALRLARGFTGRSRFIKFTGNYHGHADPFLVKGGSGLVHLPESSSAGVPPETILHTICLPYNDTKAVTEAFATFDDIAAVIVEPVAANMGLFPSSPEFLSALRKESTKSGALLIFDEVITGFRLGLRGAQGQYGITPDLTCIGKIAGGGMPLAAFGGRTDIMDHLAPIGSVYQAGTLSGNPPALAAGIATIRLAEAPGFYEELQRKTDALLDPVVKEIETRGLPMYVAKTGSCFTIFLGISRLDTGSDLDNLDPVLFERFYRYLFERGIYFSPAQQETCFLSSAHTEESLDKTRDVLLGFCKTL